jgi:hypothetical protein
MVHPCAAARHPLKGAMLVARLSRIHGILALGRQSDSCVTSRLNAII